MKSPSTRHVVLSASGSTCKCNIIALVIVQHLLLALLGFAACQLWPKVIFHGNRTVVGQPTPGVNKDAYLQSKLNLVAAPTPSLQQATEVWRQRVAVRLRKPSPARTADRPGRRPPTRVAVIVPYRNRTLQLEAFSAAIQLFLDRQRIEYEVFVLEQSATALFNRGILFNIGFLEMNRGLPAARHFQCVVLHDVDLIPVDNDNSYDCMDGGGGVPAWQLSSAIDVYNWDLPFKSTAGGVNMFVAERYEQILGFSNRYFGWGGEDDDLQARIRPAFGGYKRRDKSLGRYIVQRKGHTAGRKNPIRFQLLRVNSKLTRRHEGLPTVKYRLLGRHVLPRYTLISVDVWPLEDADVFHFSDTGLSEQQLLAKYHFKPPPEIRYEK